MNPSTVAPLVPAKAGTQRTKFLTQCMALDSRWSLPPRRRGAGMTGATHETQSILPPENLRPGTVRKYPTAWPPSAPSTLPVV